MVDSQLRDRGISDPRVLDAMGRVPRHEFVPEPYRAQAYEDHPLPIGDGQTISQPYIVALMLESLRLTAQRQGTRGWHRFGLCHCAARGTRRAGLLHRTPRISRREAPEIFSPRSATPMCVFLLATGPSDFLPAPPSTPSSSPPPLRKFLPLCFLNSATAGG